MKKILNFVFTILLNTVGIHSAVAQLPVQAYSVIDNTYGRSKSSAVLAHDGYIRRISTTNFNDPYFPEAYKLRVEKIDPNTGHVLTDVQILVPFILCKGIEAASMTSDGNIVFAYTVQDSVPNVWRTRVMKISVAGLIIYDLDAGQNVAGFKTQLVSDLLVSETGAVYITGDIFDSLNNRNLFLWKVNPQGITEYFRNFSGSSWFNISLSIFEVTNQIIIGIKPHIFNSYLMFCNSSNGDSINSIDIGAFIPYGLTLVKFPSLTVTGHMMSGIVGTNSPGVLHINLQTHTINPILMTNANGTILEVNNTSNGFVTMGSVALNGNYGLFVAWLDTKSEIIDSTLIDMSGTMSIYPDDIIIMPDRKVVILARVELYPTSPPPGLPLSTIYYNVDSYIVKFNALPCSVPIAQISPDTVYNCLKSTFVLQSIDTTEGNLYQWKRYGSILPETANTLEETRSGNYKLYVTSRTWCPKKSLTAYVQDVTPNGTITANGPLNLCSGDSVTLSVPSNPSLSYQWYKYGNLIQNAVYASFTTGSTGRYKCNITSSTGCERVSQKVDVMVDNCAYRSINDSIKFSDMPKQIEGITIFPNPATDEILVTGNMETGPILIFDMAGNLVKNELQRLPAKMVISTFKPGIYTVTTGNLSRRFVKQ